MLTMRLLIITQAVDINNPVLGFFCRWIEEFSKHCEKLTVVCLEKGEHKLPQNVKVLSLGKEASGIQHSTFNIFKKIRYSLVFFKYIWQERNNYDLVFVHMNQEYVLLGWFLWKLMAKTPSPEHLFVPYRGIRGKKVMLWRNHAKGNSLTDLAVFLSDRVFCTSRFSYTAKFKKTEIMPVGIDTDFFKRDPKIIKLRNSILFLGRISPVKKTDLFIDALNLLNKEGTEFKATIVGDAVLGDEWYYKFVKNKVSEYGLDKKIYFRKAVTNNEAVDLYNDCEVFVNLTPSGSMDKTIFEAMACENIVLVSNEGLRGKIDDMFVLEKSDDGNIAFKLKNLLSLNSGEKLRAGKKLRDFVAGEHSIKKLWERINL